jgi:hypothetical protein
MVVDQADLQDLAHGAGESLGQSSLGIINCRD